MENEQNLIMNNDPEEGILEDTLKETMEGGFSSKSEIPIQSEHCAASLSLADVTITKKDSNDSTESYSDHIMEEMGEMAKNSCDISPRKRLHRRPVLCLGISLLVMTITILLSVVVGVSVRQSMKQSMKQRPDYNDVITYLHSYNISSYTDLTELGSPQNLAARWLVELDSASLPVPTTRDYLYVTRYIMALNYFALGGEEWTKQLNFMSEKHVCAWNDVKDIFGSVVEEEIGGLLCDENGMPNILDLEFNDLAGSIPTENGLLTTLSVFDLQVNTFIKGTVPTELCSLTNLKTLTMRGNDLWGDLPSCLGHLHKLTNLNLENNNFEGHLPADLCAMTDMQYLVIQRNLFSGSLPSCIGKWSKLKVLAASDNGFTGELPIELSNLSNLQEFMMDDNRLSGNPMPIINKLTDLKIFYASDNQFSGILDTESCKDHMQLEILDISGNNFTSIELPTHLLQLLKLEILDVSLNSLKGHLPEVIPENKVLWFFSANNNLLNGGIPSALKNLSSLQHLDLSNNKLHGPLRNEIFEMTSLEILFLSENPELHQGYVPATISSMKQLKELSLKNTNRNGTLPELLDFIDLNLLDLDNNGFTGTIPENYARLPNLSHLLLNRNPIHGKIPSFHNSNLLQTVLLDGTRVSGDFSSICELPAFSGDPDFSARPVAVANCGGGNASVSCTCCHCCDASTNEKGSCSDPVVASLDWTWEYAFRREARNFGIDKSVLKNPIL